MEAEQTPLPNFEESGTSQNRIVTDQQNPSPLSSDTNNNSRNHSQQAFVSPPASNNGSPVNGIHEFPDEEIVDQEFFDALPPGYRFCPTDSDLIVHYLQKKIDNVKLPRNQIRHVNLYHHSPEKISERFPPVGEKEWYFFTPRDRKYRNGLRPNRAAGSGYWKATGADKSIKHKGASVGFRKALVFYEGKPPKGSKTNWIMHEYRVDGRPRPKTSSTDMRLDDFVLCRIYKKVDKSFKAPACDEDLEDAYGEVNEAAYLLEEDKKKEELKTFQPSAGFEQSQFPDGLRDLPHVMDDNSFAAANYFNGSFTSSVGFRPPMYAPESAFMHKYMNEGALDIKPRGIHDHIWRDYENCTLPPEIDYDFSASVENLIELDTLINNSYTSSNSFEISNSSLDNSPMPKNA